MNNSIVMYSIELFFKNSSTNEKMCLSDSFTTLFKEVTCIEELFSIFAENMNIGSHIKNDTHKTTCRVHKVVLKDSFIFGQAYYGKYGDEGVMYDTSNGEEKEISKDDSLENLYFFMIGEIEGDILLFVQRKRNLGSKNIIIDFLKIFEKRHPNIKMNVATFGLGNPKVDIEADVKKIYIRNKKQDCEDLADTYEGLQGPLQYKEQKNRLYEFGQALFKNFNTAESFFKTFIEDKGEEGAYSVIDLRVGGELFKLIYEDGEKTRGRNIVDITQEIGNSYNNFEILENLFIEHFYSIRKLYY